MTATSLPLKRVAHIEAGQSPSSEDVHRLAGGTPFLQGNAEFGTLNPSPTYECEVASKHAARGDILMSVRAPVSALNIADQRYAIGRGLCSVRAQLCDQHFLWWWLHSQVENVCSVASGSTYTAVTAEQVGQLRFPSIKQDEQLRIANFLNAETARVDKLVSLRRQMRDLLLLKRERIVEQKLGLAEAYSRSDLVPLKFLTREITVGIVVTPAAWYVEDGDGVPAIRGINVRPGRITPEDMVHISAKGHATYRKSQLREGDLVVVRTGQAGAAAVVPPEFDGANCIDVVVIRPGPELDPRYVEYVLNSDYARRHVEEYSVGTIQSHFNVGAMQQMPVPVVSREEQQRRVAALDRQVGAIDKLLAKLRQQEETLAERREALITAAVTGEIDVTTARGVDVS